MAKLDKRFKPSPELKVAVIHYIDDYVTYKTFENMPPTTSGTDDLDWEYVDAFTAIHGAFIKVEMEEEKKRTREMESKSEGAGKNNDVPRLKKARSSGPRRRFVQND